MENSIRERNQEIIIQAGKRVFWKYGIRKVTIEDICQEAGISRMTFYNYFPNKIALAVTIFRRFFDRYYLEFKALFDDNIPFRNKLEGLLRGKLEASENMSMEIVHDIYDSEFPELISLMKEMQQKSSQMTLAFIEQGKKEGSIRRDIKTEFIVFQINYILEMMKDDTLMAIFENPQQLTKHILDYFFYGIMNRNTPSG